MNPAFAWKSIMLAQTATQLGLSTALGFSCLTSLTVKTIMRKVQKIALVDFSGIC